MTRQTAFPGIWVERIGVSTPPFDEKGVIQEFVGQGVLKDLEPLQRATDFSEDTVGDFIQDAEDMIGPLRDTYRVEYSLIVRATPQSNVGPRVVSQGIQRLRKRSIKARARAFVRAKNPFEPEIINVREPSRNSRLSGDNMGDMYDVRVMVTK